MTSRIVQKVAV